MFQLVAMWFAIAGAVAATGPILIHLLNRRRFRVVDWAAMDFLREALQRSRRVMQMRDLILLVVRVLCVLLFALALAQPFFTRSEDGTLARYLLAGGAVAAMLGLAIWAVVSANRITKGIAGILSLSMLVYATWGIYDLMQHQAALAGEEGGSRQPVHAVLVIDNSLSMQYTSLARSLLDEAKAKAAAFIEELPPGSRYSVLPLCGPKADFSLEPYRTKDDARDALDAIRVVDRQGSLEAMAGLALEAIKRAPDVALKRIAFISDQQLINWPKGALEAVKDLPELQVVQVAPEDVENAWISDLKIRDGLADVEIPSMIIATVRYEGPQRRFGVQVALEVDGVQVASKSVDLEPRQTLDVVFMHKFEVSVEPGVPSFSRVKVALPQDRLPGDDQRWMMVPVVAALPVVFVDQHGKQGEDPKRGRIGETLHLRRLLAPVLSREDRGKQLIRIRHTTLDRLCRSLPPGEPLGESDLVALDDARLVVLAGIDRPDQQSAQLLREYVLQGGQLLIAGGGNFDPAAWNEIAGANGADLLPLPLTGLIGQSPAEATGDLKPFGLDFRTLKEDAYFKIENESPQRLEDLYRDRSLMFFKAIRANADDETMDAMVAEEARRIEQERQFIQQEAERAQRESQGLLNAEELQQRDEDRRRLAEIHPQWLLWRSEVEDDSRPAEEIAAATRPRVHARYDTGLPFLASRRLGQGQVALITSGVFFGAGGNGWNTMTKTDALIVYSRLLRSMIQRTLPLRNLSTDRDEIQVPVAPAYRRGRFTLVRPSGKEEPLSVGALGSDQYGLTISSAVERGTYTVTARRAAKIEAEGVDEGIDTKLWETRFAVNGPSAESEIAPLSVVQFDQRLAEAGEEIAAKVRWIGPDQTIQLEGAARGGQDFWWRAFMVGVLICLLAEVLVLAWPMLSRSPSASPVAGMKNVTTLLAAAAASLAVMTGAALLILWMTGLDHWFSFQWLRHLKLAAAWSAGEGGALILLAICTALVALSFVFYSRWQTRGSARTRTVLAMSRAVLLCLIVLILAEPLLVRRFTKFRRPQLWFLVDGTDSMAIEDELTETQRSRLVEAVGAGSLEAAIDASMNDPSSSLKQKPAGGGNSKNAARANYVRALLSKEDDNLIEALMKKFRIKFFVFDEGVRELPDFEHWVGDGRLAASQLTTRGQYTALGSAFRELSRRQATSSLAGMVVISDFTQNSGPAADLAAARLGVPIYAVGVGPAAAKDIRVRLDTPVWMTKNEKDEIFVTIEQEGVDEPAVTVKLTARRVDVADPDDAETKLIGQKRVELKGASVTVPFPYTPEETGQWIFTAEVEPLEGEVVDQNNRAEREVAIRDDFMRLMFVEYEPTWEWRFIKEVFHRDKLVGMRGFRTFLRSSDPKVRQHNKLFLPTLTPKRSEFFANDVIFLGDMPAATLSTRFCQLTKEFVGKFGGGLVIISGPRFGPGQLAATPLADMLPVVVDPDLRLRDDREFALKLTAEASGYPFMRLGGGPQENAKAWKNLDRLPWYQPVARANDRATVLAVHPEDRCSDGQPQPLIAVRQYGAGIVVYLAFDETWRLRKLYGEKYYRQFWGQMIHQLASRRALGTQKRFVVKADRLEYRVDDKAVLFVEAYDAEYNALPDEKLDGGKLIAEVTLPGRTPAGELRIERFSVTRRRDAQFEATIPLDAGGEYRVRVKDPITGRYAETKFHVKDVSAERRSAVRNVSLQNSVAAAVEGGKTYELHEAARLIDEIHLPKKLETRIEVRPVWSTWFCFILVLSLMLGEWLLRKLVTLP